MCKRFAADGLKVIVAGRTQSAIDTIAADITRGGGQAVPIVADATSESDIGELFDAAGTELDLAIYNAGNNTPGKIIDMEAAYFEQSWRVVCFGGFLFGREAIRRMLLKKAGTILFTGASASLRGRPNYGAFNSAKAGLRTLAQAMAKEYAEDGIHVGHVIVDGAIAGDKIFHRFPDAANREDGLISIEAIVNAFAFLYSAEEEEGAIKALLGQNIEALILVGVNQTRAARRVLERLRIPVVQTFELVDDPIDLNVGLSQRKGGYAATRFLLDLGHRRIAYLSGQRDDRARARLKGYCAALEEAGLDCSLLVGSLPAQATISLGRKLTLDMLAVEAPDAIFCCDDNIALGALFACQQVGLDVPGRISLIGFNDLEFAAASNPPLSTVLTPRADMGRVASELVLQVIATGKRPASRQIDLGFEIVARGSTGPRAARP